MSFVLDPVTISSTTGGTVTIPNAPAQVIALDLYNASPIDLQVLGLPNGPFWLMMNHGMVVYTRPGPLGTLTFKAAQVPNVSSSPTSSVLITGYVAGDMPPAPGTYYIGRLNNIGNGGTIVTSTAVLQGTGQSQGLTEQDVTIGLQSGGPNLYPATQGEGLYLSSNANGTPSKSIHIRQDGNLDLFLASVVFYNGSSPLAGQGLVPIVAAAQDFQVTTTGLKTVLTFTVGANNGLFRINWSAKVSNAVSGNAITAQVGFFDTSGGGHTVFLNAVGGGGANNTLGFIGSNSIANSWYPGLSEMIGCKAGTTITISYNDPTNTPNDFVSAVIEQLL